MGGAGQPSLEIGGERRSLAGPWKFRVGSVSLAPDEQHVNHVPTLLYNKMVHPLRSYPVAGVIWYQGESNANSDVQAAEYRQRFNALIRQWRRAWGEAAGPIPFLWVQLPNFGAVDAEPPAHAAWATLRESQTAALSLPRTGQAVAIDLGDPGDIHPRNKQEVGRRLALVSLKVAYRRAVTASGPTYRSHVVRAARVVVKFQVPGGGLTTRGSGDAVTGFAVAGADRRFVWANARLEGGRVVVWSDAVPHPVAVRYGWSNSPAHLSLYARSGLPAAPFRTDSW